MPQHKFNRRQWLQTTALGSLGGLAAVYLPKLPLLPTTQATPPATPPAPALAENMAKVANSFLATLEDAQRTKITYAFEDSERQRWHWTTPAGFPRNGIAVKDMSVAQKILAFALLEASTSKYGYQKALDIMTLQRDLSSDTELYYVTIFGTPGSDKAWGWRWEGHHLSRHFTIVGDQVAVTPYFLGAWPNTTDKGFRAMPREEDAARELITSLQGAARQKAIFRTNTLTNHVTSNNAVVKPLDPVGIPYGELSADQQKLVVEVLQTYLKVLPDEIALANWTRIQDAGLDAIRFGWSGSLEARRPHYYRIQGANFLLEFDNSRNGGTHIHSVWRDFERDFGYHLL
jgi:hypothetical protein